MKLNGLLNGLKKFIWYRFDNNKNKSTMMITAQKTRFPIKNFFSKCDQIRSFWRIWLHLLKKPLIENFVFCTVNTVPVHNLTTIRSIHPEIFYCLGPIFCYELPRSRKCYCIIHISTRLKTLAFLMYFEEFWINLKEISH